MSGRSDANIPFQDMRRLLKRLGFLEHIKGDHHVFRKPGLAEIINLQPEGDKAKAYQVRQVRGIIGKYGLDQ